MKFNYTEEYVVVPLDKEGRNWEHAYRSGNTHCEDMEFESMKELFETLQESYGRCKGKVYCDTPEDDSAHIGWIFEKKEEYERDSYAGQRQYYILETWVSLYTLCDSCSGFGRHPLVIEHPSWPPEEQACSSLENPL